MLDGLTESIDTGGDDNPGMISLYEGEMPDAPENNTGRLLAVLPFSYPAFHAARFGAAESYDIEQRNALATGRIGWARISDGNGNVVLDGDVGTEETRGVRPFVVLNTVETFVGGPVVLKSAKLILPAT